jgi:acetylornithine aminotransferase
MHRASSTIRASAAATARLHTRIPRLKHSMSGVAATPESTPTTQALLDLSAAYLLPVYARPDFVLSHGHGSYVYDTAGKRYLDFSAGIAVNALGHADEGVVKVRAGFSRFERTLMHFYVFFFWYTNFIFNMNL